MSPNGAWLALWLSLLPSAAHSTSVARESGEQDGHEVLSEAAGGIMDDKARRFDCNDEWCCDFEMVSCGWTAEKRAYCTAVLGKECSGEGVDEDGGDGSTEGTPAPTTSPRRRRSDGAPESATRRRRSDGTGRRRDDTTRRETTTTASTTRKTTTTGVHRYDCSAGLDKCSTMWTQDKKDWCKEKGKTHCGGDDSEGGAPTDAPPSPTQQPPTPSPPAPTGAPPAPTDAPSPTQQPPTPSPPAPTGAPPAPTDAPSPTQQPPTPSNPGSPQHCDMDEPYVCSGGHSSTWSDEKKTWCCDCRDICAPMTTSTAAPTTSTAVPTTSTGAPTTTTGAPTTKHGDGDGDLDGSSEGGGGTPESSTSPKPESSTSPKPESSTTPKPEGSTTGETTKQETTKPADGDGELDGSSEEGSEENSNTATPTAAPTPAPTEKTTTPSAPQQCDMADAYVCSGGHPTTWSGAKRTWCCDCRDICETTAAPTTTTGAPATTSSTTAETTQPGNGDGDLDGSSEGGSNEGGDGGEGGGGDGGDGGGGDGDLDGSSEGGGEGETTTPATTTEEPTTPEPRCDMADGYVCTGDRRATWSHAKRSWCCSCQNVCSDSGDGDAFDCGRGFATWVDDYWAPWTQERREWCCENENVGCPRHAGPIRLHETRAVSWRQKEPRVRGAARAALLLAAGSLASLAGLFVIQAVRAASRRQSERRVQELSELDRCGSGGAAQRGPADHRMLLTSTTNDVDS